MPAAVCELWLVIVAPAPAVQAPVGWTPPVMLLVHEKLPGVVCAQLADAENGAALTAASASTTPAPQPTHVSWCVAVPCRMAST